MLLEEGPFRRSYIVCHIYHTISHYHIICKNNGQYIGTLYTQTTTSKDEVGVVPRPPLRLVRWQYNGIINVACGRCYLVFNTSLLNF